MTPKNFPDSRAGIFPEEDRVQVLRLLSAGGVSLDDLPSAEQAAMVEASMLGASLAMFATPGQDLGGVAKRCVVVSRRRLLRALRALCHPGSTFRHEATRTGGGGAELEIRTNLVRFARCASQVA